MRATGLVKTSEIENEVLSNILKKITTFFKYYDIDIKPFIAIRLYAFGTEILSINIDRITEKIGAKSAHTLWEIGIRGTSSEKRKALTDILCNKFFKENENMPNKEYKINTSHNATNYCLTASGKFFDDTIEDDSIKSQFQLGITSICSFQIELITNTLFYSLEEVIGICAIQNIWNMLEAGNINDFQASILLKSFYRSMELKMSSDMMYGDGHYIIKEMLREMGADISFMPTYDWEIGITPEKETAI